KEHAEEGHLDGKTPRGIARDYRRRFPRMPLRQWRHGDRRQQRAGFPIIHNRSKSWHEVPGVMSAKKFSARFSLTARQPSFPSNIAMSSTYHIWWVRFCLPLFACEPFRTVPILGACRSSRHQIWRTEIIPRRGFLPLRQRARRRRTVPETVAQRDPNGASSVSRGSDHAHSPSVHG